MERIKLEKGLIALGSGKKVGKTIFALKLANHIAKNENVLFISYTDYKEKLIKIVKEIDGHINEKLEINTSFAFWGSETFLDIIKHIKTKNISTVFIDDVENFCGVETEDWFVDDKYNVIKNMKYLSELLDIKFVFLVRTTQLKFEKKYTPSIKNFRWSRAIINECTQIFELYRPSYYGYLEDSYGNSIQHQIEIHYLKNKENEEKEFIFNNQKERIYINKAITTKEKDSESIKVDDCSKLKDILDEFFNE